MLVSFSHKKQAHLKTLTVKLLDGWCEVDGVNLTKLTIKTLKIIYLVGGRKAAIAAIELQALADRSRPKADVADYTT